MQVQIVDKAFVSYCKTIEQHYIVIGTSVSITFIPYSPWYGSLLVYVVALCLRGLGFDSCKAYSTEVGI